MNKTIVIVALSVAFVSESFMYVYSHTLQRSADDLAKIQLTSQPSNEIEQKVKEFNDCENHMDKSAIDQCYKAVFENH